MADHGEVPLDSKPKTIDPQEYFNLTPEKRRAEEARAGIRANLKRQFQLQLNNPHRTEVIEDPALNQWVFARANPYAHFKVTSKTSLLGTAFAVVPLFFFYFLFKTDRDRKEEMIKAGTYEPKLRLPS